MTDTRTASDIFTLFQTRRDVLRRTGQIGLAAGLPLALAGCLEVPDNAFREVSGGALEIQVSDGRNCWMNQCFTYDARDNEVSVTGREPIAVPEDIDLSDGYVTEAEFDQILKTARSADRIQNESDGGGGSGVPPGNGGPGGFF